MKMYINVDQTMSHVSFTRAAMPGAYLTDDLSDVVKAIHDGGEAITCIHNLTQAADYLCDGEAMAATGITDEHEQAVNYLHQSIMDYLCESELYELEATDYRDYD